MASDVKGVNNTKADNPIPENVVPRGEFNAQEYVAIDTYNSTAIVTGSTIELCPNLPLGATLTEVSIQHGALGTSVTLAIGDGTTAAKYKAAASAAAAGTLVANLNMNTSLSGGNIVLTTGGATLDADILVTAIVKYVLK